MERLDDIRPSPVFGWGVVGGDGTPPGLQTMQENKQPHLKRNKKGAETTGEGVETDVSVIYKTIQKSWGSFAYPIAVCEVCQLQIQPSYIEEEPDVTYAEFLHDHQLSFIILRAEGSTRTYEIEGEGSPDLLNLLKWAGEVWLMPSDVRKDVSDVCLYIRQRLGEI
jgi:hypothetical protein